MHTTPSYAAPPSRASQGMIKHKLGHLHILTYLPCHILPLREDRAFALLLGSMQSKTVLALLLVEALRKTGTRESVNSPVNDNPPSNEFVVSIDVPQTIRHAHTVLTLM